MKVLFLSIFIAIPLSSKLQAEETTKELRWTTMEWTKVANQDKTGLYFDLIELVYTDYKKRHSFLPYERGIAMLKQNKVDAISICHKDKDIIVSKYPWAQATISIVYKKSEALKNIKKESLDKFSIASPQDVVANYPELKKLSNLKIVKNNTAAFNMLLNNRVKAIIDAKTHQLNEIRKHNKIKTEKLTLNDFNWTEYTKTICSPGFKNSEDGKKFLTVWENKISQLKDSKKLKNLFKKWDMEYPY